MSPFRLLAGFLMDRVSLVRELTDATDRAVKAEALRVADAETIRSLREQVRTERQGREFAEQVAGLREWTP